MRRGLESLGSVAVAFSGGTDSAFLLACAHDALGESCVAVTALSCFVPEREVQEARRFCALRGITQLEVRMDPLSVEGVAENPPERCYLCKKAVFSRIRNEASARGISCVAEGTNADDEGDFRPGLAAVAELGIKSPLKEFGFTKAEVRAASRTFGLSTWSKPSAACLASRIPYGEPLTRRALGMAERAEQFLSERGFPQVRVRIHGGTLARIEVPPADFEKLMRIRTDVVAALTAAGFTYVSLDLLGFRAGSMNEALKRS
ncbi:MAG: ATP-dependent sacrificial sulfur transferase LarE [Treponemataceae bacterium]|nr:ATP-dependent sacrificial sulfur transferase LarE [Treponemataceae bacterium]